MNRYLNLPACLLTAGCVALGLLGPAPAHAQDAAAPAAAEPADAQALIKQIENKYAGIDTYQSTVKMTARDNQGNTFVDSDSSVVFDRENHRLLLRRPEATLLMDGKKVVLVSAALNEQARHKLYFGGEIETPGDFGQLVRLLPMVEQMATPDVIFLLGKNAYEDIENLELAKAPEGDAVTGLAGSMGPASVTVGVDANRLIETTKMQAPMQGGEVIVTYANRGTKVGGDLPEKAFDVDLAGLEKTDSLETFFGSSAAPDPQSLVGEVPPAIKAPYLDGGKPFELAKAVKDDRIVILDFWATWCGPCRVTIPILQDTQNWADENDLPVQVYLLNLAETKATVNQYRKQNGLTLPIVMLTRQNDASNEYFVTGIPTSFVLVDGKVVEATVGVDPNYKEKLRKVINEHLKEQPEGETDAATGADEAADE